MVLKAFPTSLLIPIIFGIIILSGCSPSFEEQFPDTYEKYMSFPENKALAISIDTNGGHAFGYGYGNKTIKGAKERALLECNARRTAYKLKQECEIYMVNDKKIEEK